MVQPLHLQRPSPPSPLFPSLPCTLLLPPCHKGSLRSSLRCSASPPGPSSFSSSFSSSCGIDGSGDVSGLSSRSCEGGLAALASRQRRAAAAAAVAAGRNSKIEVRECPEVGRSLAWCCWEVCGFGVVSVLAVCRCTTSVATPLLRATYVRPRRRFPG